MPELGSYEVRLNHAQILAAALTGMALPPGVSPSSVMALLSSAAAVSAAHSTSEGASSGGAPLGHANSSTMADAAAPGAAGGQNGAGAAAAGSTGDGSGAASAAGGGAAGRSHTWPSIRVGLDGLGLDSTPVSRCRQCVLQIPGEDGPHTLEWMNGQYPPLFVYCALGSLSWTFCTMHKRLVQTVDCLASCV